MTNQHRVQLTGPERYALTFDSNSYRVSGGKFSGIAAKPGPKLYVVCADEAVVYVGVTKQRMSNRLRFGFVSIGAHGYHGYAWRHSYTDATLYVWGQADASMLDIETIEAEVVFLARQAGQWPLGQTEIHFHPSTESHRAAAAAVWQLVTKRNAAS